MKTTYYQIAIDGPSGSGKSSVAKQLAKQLNFTFINTGGMYRCYALALIKNNIDINDLNALMETLKNNKVDLKGDKLYLNNKDVTEQLSSQEVALMASKIGTINEVRQFCVAAQQEIAKGVNCVMEGRDIGTVVLPNATLKVFLDAPVDLRVERRWLQNNKSEPIELVKKKIIERDYQDTHRKFSPLTKLPESYVIYDTGLSIQEVTDMIIKKLKEKINE